MAINENESRYRCCCGACRAKVGAAWVAGFEGLVAVTFLIFGIICQTRMADDDDRRYQSIAAPLFYTLAVISAIFVVALALGLALRKGWLLIIHMVKCGIFVGLLGIMIILGIMVVVTAGTGALAIGAVDDGGVDHQHRDAKDTFVAVTLFAIVDVVINGIFAILQIWFIFVVLAAYRAIRDDKRTRGGVVLSPPPQQMTVITQPSSIGGPDYQSGTYRATTYYPSGGVTASAPPTSYEQMSAGYPTAPPPYSEKE